LINKRGDINKLKLALEFQDNYELVINKALKLLRNLENSSEIIRKILLKDKAKIYQELHNLKEMSSNSDNINTIDEIF
jgi:hypothetical protein